MVPKCTFLFALQGFQQGPVHIHGPLIKKSTLFAKYGDSYLQELYLVRNKPIQKSLRGNTKDFCVLLIYVRALYNSCFYYSHLYAGYIRRIQSMRLEALILQNEFITTDF